MADAGSSRVDLDERTRERQTEVRQRSWADGARREAAVDVAHAWSQRRSAR